MYYVYQHKTADTNSIFYIGKGKGKRAFTKCNRSQYWKNVVAKHGLQIDFVVKDVDEELAFLVEAECIDQNKKLGIKLIKHWINTYGQHIDHSWQKLWKLNNVFFHRPQLFHQNEGYSNQNDVDYRETTIPFNWELYETIHKSDI